MPARPPRRLATLAMAGLFALSACRDSSTGLSEAARRTRAGVASDSVRLDTTAVAFDSVRRSPRPEVQLL
jgi:hypothetical protein